LTTLLIYGDAIANQQNSWSDWTYTRIYRAEKDGVGVVELMLETSLRRVLATGCRIIVRT